MIFSTLDAAGYQYSAPFYNAEFEGLLSKIVACYQLMISDNLSLQNDENDIRDVFLINYLRNNAIRKRVGLLEFLFDREVPEDHGPGRTDIKIQTQNTFQDTQDYYTIECKRLDASNLTGTTGLNALYIREGICRFTAGIYSTYNRTNGMIGFLVRKMNIHENIGRLNTLLKDSFRQANTIMAISKRDFIVDFEYSYYSTHHMPDGEMTIYHLMFDFSNNIK